MGKNQSLKSLNDNDHLTKRGGGSPTHAEGKNFKLPELPQRAKSTHSGGRMAEPIGPKSSGNYGDGAKGAHKGATVGAHGANKPHANKKLSK